MLVTWEQVILSFSPSAPVPDSQIHPQQQQGNVHKAGPTCRHWALSQLKGPQREQITLGPCAEPALMGNTVLL